VLSKTLLYIIPVRDEGQLINKKLTTEFTENTELLNPFNSGQRSGDIRPENPVTSGHMILDYPGKARHLITEYKI
jgi:hypothetical protein